MKIDIEKIRLVYGNDTLKLVKENFEDIKKNIKYLEQLGFNDVVDIFERYVVIFICDCSYFKENINKLIKKLGENYVERIENNLNLLEDLI